MIGGAAPSAISSCSAIRCWSRRWWRAPSSAACTCRRGTWFDMWSGASRSKAGVRSRSRRRSDGRRCSRGVRTARICGRWVVVKYASARTRGSACRGATARGRASARPKRRSTRSRRARRAAGAPGNAPRRLLEREARGVRERVTSRSREKMVRLDAVRPSPVARIVAPRRRSRAGGCCPASRRARPRAAHCSTGRASADRAVRKQWR